MILVNILESLYLLNSSKPKEQLRLMEIYSYFWYLDMNPCIGRVVFFRDYMMCIIFQPI